MDKVELTIIAIDKATDVISGVSGALGNIGKLAAKTAVFVAGAAVAGVTAATALLASTIKPASDLDETISKNKVVFGEASEEVIAFGKNAAKSLGMSTNEALTAAGTYGNLLRSMELSNQESAKMSTTMVQLAGDLASFNNVPVEDALNAIRSGLVGENEPLKRFGVNINEASLKAKALAMGLYSGKGAITAAAKAQAAYQIILEQTSLAQGDFSRTSTGLANSQRVLGATLENVRATIGTALLPVIANLMGKLNTIVTSDKFTAFINTLADNIGKLAMQALELIEKIDWVKFFTDVQKGWKTFSDGVTNMWAVVEPIFKEIGGVIGTVWDILKDGIQPGDIENIMLLIGALGTRIKEWASNIDWGGMLTSLLAKLSEIGTAIITWAGSPTTIAAVQNAGFTIGEYLGGALRLTVETTVNAIGKWFSDGKGFENACKLDEVTKSVSVALVSGITTGFVKGLFGVDISADISKWLKWSIDNGLTLFNPATYLQNVINSAIKLLTYPINTAYGITHSSVHGRASGGSVTAGRPYYVGEQGTELFVPSQNGTIVNNSSLSRRNGINIVLNYSPMMSLADKNEAQEKLLPFIRDGLRAAGVA